MAIADDLYSRVEGAPVVATGLPMIVLLTGFTDAGSAVAGLLGHFEEISDLHPVVIFSNDSLLDYRARRPIIHFDKDHLTGYQPPRLELAIGHDALGQQFLLLFGYEPDFAWEAFTQAVSMLVNQYQVSTVSWVHSIAMPVPHTRPIGITVSGNRKDLLKDSLWRPQTQVPTTAGHLLEYRLMQEHERIAGFVLLMSHYLADTESPPAVLAAANRIMTATGLVFDMDAVSEKAEDYLFRINEQVVASEELQAMISGLEARYDGYVAGLGQAQESSFSEQDLPSADELAAELERFLASGSQTDEDHSGFM